MMLTPLEIKDSSEDFICVCVCVCIRNTYIYIHNEVYSSLQRRRSTFRSDFRHLEYVTYAYIVQTLSVIQVYAI
jgi:hypothetical protein